MIRDMKDLDIAIVGAGIAGLTAARALQTFGFRVRVYEQASRLGEVGAGLTISPNATHVLNAIGLEGVLERIGMRPTRGGVKHWRTGELLVEIPRGQDMLARYGAAYYQVHRADLHAALAEAIQAHDPEAIVLGRCFESLLDDGQRVQLRFTGGASANAAVAIGADGLRSNVRQTLFGAQQPKFTGYIAYRGLVPVSRLPAGIINPTSCLSTGPGRSFTRYLLRGGTLVNFVGLCERHDWAEEGWSIRSTVEELLAEFEGWTPWVLRFMEQVPPELLFKWGLFDREPLTRWSQGRATLLGDAAHPVLPFLGHGAVLAIEDGVVLGRAIAASTSIEEALQRYEKARLERAAFVVHESRKAGKQYHVPDADSYGQRTGNKPADEGIGLFSYNPVTQVI